MKDYVINIFMCELLASFGKVSFNVDLCVFEMENKKNFIYESYAMLIENKILL